MLYGSMLGLLGAAVLGTLAARYFGLSSFQDLKPSPDPNGTALQRWLQPYKERIQVSWFGSGYKLQQLGTEVHLWVLKALLSLYIIDM